MFIIEELNNNYGFRNIFKKPKINEENQKLPTINNTQHNKIVNTTEWIEVYGYKGLDKNMCANIIEEGIIPYELNKTYKLDTDEVITNYKGFNLSYELNGTFEKHDPLQHCRYFKVRAIVDKKEWEKVKNKRTLKDNIASKEIELLKEVLIDYDTIINKYDYYRTNQECLIQNVFPTVEKWIKFSSNKDINLHNFIIKENFYKLKYSKCILSDSLIKIILKKVEDVTTNRYRGIEDLNKNIIIYSYIQKIIDLILIDKISKETILKLLCNNILF